MSIVVVEYDKESYGYAFFTIMPLERGRKRRKNRLKRLVPNYVGLEEESIAG